MKRNHAGRAIGSQADSEQPGRRRDGVRRCAKSGLRGRIPRNAGQHEARQSKIGMIKHIKELTFNPQLHPLAQRKQLGYVEVTPEEIGTAQSIAPQISELAQFCGLSPP
jgi:hypothetical protein